MIILETFSSFLANEEEGKYYESSTVTYRRKLDVFYEYLFIECNLTDNNWEDILRGMDEKKFSASAVFYIEHYNVQFASTLDNFLSVIYSYFRYIRDTLKIMNTIIDSEEKLKNLKKFIHLKTKDFGLVTKEQKSPINDDVYNNLLEYCDECINNPKSELIKTKGYNKPFTDFVSAIITKLVMLTGVKSKCIKSLVRKDVKDKLNIIKINNYWIHLPNNYALQMRSYLEIRDSIVGKDPAKALFITSQGKPLTSNASMFEVLNPILECKEAESVAKFTIMQIKGELSLGLIKKLTGLSFETCLHCAELVEEDNEKSDKNNVNRQIDSKLRGLAIFDKL